MIILHCLPLSAASVCPYYTCPVAFWSLSALEQLQSPHLQQHNRCLSGVWSGTTLRRASVQLSKPSDTPHSAKTYGIIWPQSQTSSTWTTDELLDYHNNNNNNCMLIRVIPDMEVLNFEIESFAIVFVGRHFVKTFCCRMYHLAAVHSVTDRQTDSIVMTVAHHTECRMTS